MVCAMKMHSLITSPLNASLNMVLPSLPLVLLSGIGIAEISISWKR